MEKIKVLVVDDEPDLLNLTEIFLGSYPDISTSPAGSAQEALDVLDREDYEVIVSDYQMPSMNGLQFLKELKDRKCEVPFILFTGRGREDVVVEALNLGASFYLQKGGDPRAQYTELANMIKRSAETFRAKKALKESENRFRNLVQNSSDFIAILNDEGTVMYTSSSSERILGYHENFLVGKSALQIIHPDDRELILSELMLVKDDHQDGQPTEFRVLKANGEYIPVEAVGRNMSGVPNVNGMVITIRPIVERKNAEEALKASRENYRDLLLNAPTAIYELDQSGLRFKSVNNAMCQMTGYSREELLASNPFDLLDPESQVLFDERIKNVLSGIGSTDNAEFRGIYKNGVRGWFTISVKPIFRAGKLKSIFVVANDITERKMAEEDLRKANTKLNLLGDITRHDALNQTMIIQGYASIFKGDNLTPEQLAYIKKIQTSARTIQRQMEFTKLYQEIGVHAPTWQSLHEYICKVRSALDLGDILLKVDETDYAICADPMFEKVVFNLIDNCVRHSGEARQIMITTSESRGRLKVVFEDDGHGISQEDKPHLFERGFGKNTGFGLFLSREVLGITGITIQETGGNGMGARFEILVPAGMFRSSIAEAK